MAKFRIPVENLPPPYLDGTHTFRFRMLTEDRNNFSEWSPLYSVSSLGQIYPLQSQYTINATPTLVDLYWDTPSYYNVTGASVLHNHESEWKIHDSDIFVKFNDELTTDFIYWGRSTENNFSIIPYASATSIRIIVQVANHPPKLSNIFQILDTGVVSLV